MAEPARDGLKMVELNPGITGSHFSRLRLVKNVFKRASEAIERWQDWFWVY